MRAGKALVMFASAVAAGLLLFVSVSQGPSDIGWRKTLSVLLPVSLPLDGFSYEPWEAVVIWQIRLPRLVAGLLVGGGLSISGALMQAVFRNPMADPGITGVTSGAAFGATAAIFFHLERFGQLAIPASSFLGAAVCSFVVYVIATNQGRTAVTTLLLAGIAVASLATSLTSLMLYLSLQDYEVSRNVMFWLMGGLDSKSWLEVGRAAPIILLGSSLALFFSRDLNALALGEATATSLGVSVPQIRRVMLVLVAAITGSAVAISGSIAFVGLVVPHIVRLVLGPDHKRLLPASFVCGAFLLVVADLVARTLVVPSELRLGLVTSMIGGPFFLYLLIKHRSRVERL